MPSLLAVLLIVRSRPGPHLVYAYPPDARRTPPRIDRQGDDSDSDSDANVNSVAALRRPNTHGHRGTHSHESPQSGVSNGKDKTQASESEQFLGFSINSLERLLAPGRWSDRKKFEACIDGVKFVGHPISAHEDGKWSRKDGQRAERPMSPLDDRYGDYTNFGITVTEPPSPVQAQRDRPRPSESLDSQLAVSLGTSVNSTSVTSSTETTVAAQIEMFSVVFAFDTAAEAETESEQIYRHIIRKLSKAMHYCQKQSGYVGTETRRINAITARAKLEHAGDVALQQRILEGSELAWALREVYDCVTAGAIAGIRLGGQPMSLHVPPEVQYGQSTLACPMEPSAGLLLLEDKGPLLRELSHPEASPLAHFIREHTPTKSLSKLAVRMGMSFDEVIFLARHLVKWNKARPIMALHPRNTYVVQPDAPLARLSELTIDYARRFQGLPSLPQMLKFLGGNAKPIKYGMLIPSRDHRTPFMDILAWLVRHGFVAQLKTFGWLRCVSKRRIRQLAEQNEALPIQENQNRVPMTVASLLSPQLRAVDDDDSLSVSSERTAIPLRSHSALRSSAPTSMPAAKAQEDDAKHEDEGQEEDDPWHIILDPAANLDGVATLRQAIADDELAERLPSLLKYFKGEEALEGIAGAEGLKREVVERWIETLQKEGLIKTIRHL